MLMKTDAVSGADTQKNWIPAIDGCRAIAALAVVVDHYQPWRDDLSDVALFRVWHAACGLFGFGALGVIFFFALSSFLLTSLSLREIAETGQFSIRKFYTRRMLRIWPLYYTILAVYFVLGLFITKQFNGVGNQWAAEFWIYPLFLQNWFNVTRWDMGILWTLGVEEQFYILFPWVLSLLLLLRSRSATTLVLIVVVIAASIFRIAVGSGAIQPIFWYKALPIHGIYFSTFSYLDVFVAGAIAGWFYVNRLSLAVLQLPGIGMLIVATILTVGSSPTWGIAKENLLGDANIYLVYYTLLGASFAAGILWLCANPQSTLVRFLSSRTMRRLGQVSFGIYMWHIIAKVIVLTICEKIQMSAPTYFAVSTACYFGLTIGLALLSYRFVERPWIARKSAFYGTDNRFAFPCVRPIRVRALSLRIPPASIDPAVIPSPVDQNRWAHWRNPMDMIRQG